MKKTLLGIVAGALLLSGCTGGEALESEGFIIHRERESLARPDLYKVYIPSEKKYGEYESPNHAYQEGEKVKVYYREEYLDVIILGVTTLERKEIGK